MKTIIKRLYEGLFLVDSGEATADWQAVIGAIERILARSEAEVVSLRKWDERRLAYDVAKKNRGTYILVYFNCDPARIGAIERDVQLSEAIMRVMILRTDKMSPEDIAKPTPAMLTEMDEATANAKRQEAHQREEQRQAEEAEKTAAAESAETPEAVEDNEQEESSGDEA